MSKIVEWPPKLRPVPVKPVFLDTAWNYIEYPGRKPVVEEVREEANGEKEVEKPTKRGWFGFGGR